MDEIKKSLFDRKREILEHAILEICAQYGTIKKELLANKEFMAELERSIYEVNVGPVLDEYIEKGFLKEEQKAELYALVAEWAASPPGEEQAAMRRKIQLYFNALPDVFHEMASIKFRAGIDEFFQRLASQTAGEIHRKYKQTFFRWGIEDKAREAMDDRNFQFIDFDNSGLTYIIHKRKFWAGMRASKKCKELLGDEIQEVDELNYNIALERSLIDREGSYIDTLALYPTPEAIRNLALIAAADVKNYRTKHAFSVLKKLAADKNYEQVLKESIGVYPELAGIFETLLNWQQAEGVNVELRRGVVPLTSKILGGDKQDLNLYNLAAEAAPTGELLQMARDQGAIEPETYGAITDAFRVIDVINAENENYEGGPVYQLDDQFLKAAVREQLIGIFQEYLPGERKRELDRLAVAAERIITAKDNPEMVEYILQIAVTNTFRSGSQENTEKLLDAPNTIPDLIDVDTTRTNCLRPIFLKQIHDSTATLDETIELMKLFATKADYRLLYDFKREIVERGTMTLEKAVQVAEVATLIYEKFYDSRPVFTLLNNQALTPERLRELPPILDKVKQLPEHLKDLVINHAEMFLATNDGTEWLDPQTKEGVSSIPPDVDQRMGAHVFGIRQKISNIEDVIGAIIINEGNIAYDAADEQNKKVTIDPTNWVKNLALYLRAQFDENEAYAQFKSDFEKGPAKDAALKELTAKWRSALKNGEPLPLSLYMVVKVIEDNGTGPLSRLQALGSLMAVCEDVLATKALAKKTETNVRSGLAAIEERFEKERWSQDAHADFYNISRDILSAAPSLYDEFLKLFEKCSAKELQLFMSETYPFYRAKLAMMKKTEQQYDRNARQYGLKDLARLRKEIRNFAQKLDGGTKVFADKKRELLEDLAKAFKTKFGIIKVPENFGQDQIRSITNMSLYLSNLNGHDPKNEAILGFYLGLMLNDQWDAFRRDEDINPDEFMAPEKCAEIRQKLEERKIQSPLKPESVGIKPEEWGEFMKLLQADASVIAIGNVETVDARLNNVIVNLEGLEDLDLYPDAMDKERVKLLTEFGYEKVGKTAAKFYQQLEGKNISFSDEEQKVKERMEKIITDNGLPLGKAEVKKQFQDLIKPLATVINILEFTRELDAKGEITKIQELLHPAQEIISIFNRLGEDFTPASGALALTHDLNYLDNLIAKREKDLTLDELESLKNYIGKIREQLVKLEAMYEQIKAKFSKIRKGSDRGANNQLGNKLEQLQKIIDSSNEQKSIVSTVTANLNTLVENIRECLSCTSQGCNNDTNITFGDSNKFFICAQTESKTIGSIADQIIFLEPTTHADGSMDMSFVMDRSYGTNTADLLQNNIDALVKKMQLIKNKFPEARLSIFVTDSASVVAGLSKENLLARLQGGKTKNLQAVLENVEIDVVPSALGDHYIEFGGGSRTSGKRMVGGVRLMVA